MDWLTAFAPIFQAIGAVSAAIAIVRALVPLFKKIHRNTVPYATQVIDYARRKGVKTPHIVVFTETRSKKASQLGV